MQPIDFPHWREEGIRWFFRAARNEPRPVAKTQTSGQPDQWQALNALVFLYREALGRELGDFSDYRRAKVRTHLPVWLTREESPLDG